MTVISLSPPFGYKTCAYALRPTLADINMGPYRSPLGGNLFNGAWYEAPVPNPGFYSESADDSMPEGYLTLSYPGGAKADGSSLQGPYLATASTNSTPGNLPLLEAGKGYRVRSVMRVRPAQIGNWFCHWSMPIEHSFANLTVNAALGGSYYRELDGHEGGAGKALGEGSGMWGAAVLWQPENTKLILPNPYSDLLFNPAHWHLYEYWWEPSGLAGWAIDDTVIGLVNVAAHMTPAQLAWVNAMHDYQIWDADSSAPNASYALDIASMEAWTP